MNRRLIVAGLVAFGLLLFVFIAAGIAAPERMPAFDSPNNDFCDTADHLDVPGFTTGVVSETDVVDYYEIYAEPGRKYQASLSILGTTGDLETRLRIYNDLCEYTSLQNESSILWTASVYTYYVRVEALTSSTTTVQTANYRLDVDRIAPDPTATNTPPPTNTPLPTVVSTADPYEGSPNNNEPARAYVFPVTTYLKLSEYLGVATFHTLDPNRDADWYKFWAKDDKWYRIATSELSGVDTRVVIYKSNGTSQVTSNDDGGGGYASLVSFEARYDGYYYIRVHNKVNTTGSYNMTVEEISEPTPGPTATPGPGASTEADPCENNADFAHACIIAANNPEKFNFVPPYGGVDNDFFKLWIKPGYNYTCFTSDLDAGVDPNMILYYGPSNDNLIGGNDDHHDIDPSADPTDLNSWFTYYSTYEGWMYILVGYGDRTPSDIYNSSYTLECKMSVPGSPTATSTPVVVATSTPRPTGTPAPTATPAGLTIRKLTDPTPIPVISPEPVLLPINLLVYYDANGDGQPGAGEGIAGISVQAYDVTTGELLAQGITDEQGYLEFAVRAQGAVRVTVPFFGFSQVVAGEETAIRLQVSTLSRPGGGP